MTWERGRADVERLLAQEELERVTPSEAVAERMLADAEAHIRLAEKGVEDDPVGVLQLAYDAARKASAALLAVQGLRATIRGGHIAVLDTVQAQFDDRGAVTVFGRIHRLRRRRHDSEYPSDDSPTVTKADAERALGIARESVEVARKLLASGSLSRFE